MSESTLKTRSSFFLNFRSIQKSTLSIKIRRSWLWNSVFRYFIDLSYLRFSFLLFVYWYSWYCTQLQLRNVYGIVVSRMMYWSWDSSCSFIVRVCFHEWCFAWVWKESCLFSFATQVVFLSSCVGVFSLNLLECFFNTLPHVLYSYRSLLTR